MRRPAPRRIISFRRRRRSLCPPVLYLIIRPARTFFFSFFLCSFRRQSLQKLLEQLGEDNDSLAKDGPSFSFKIDSDCRGICSSAAGSSFYCRPHRSTTNAKFFFSPRLFLCPLLRSPDKKTPVPSVSGADTMSLSSLISSPEPTSTSPHHAKYYDPIMDYSTALLWSFCYSEGKTVAKACELLPGMATSSSSSSSRQR